MSSHDDEIKDGERAIKNAHGDVLVAGLGLGLIVRQLWGKKEVTSVSIIEIDKEVIAKTKQHLLLSKWITNEQFDKTKFIHADAFKPFDIIDLQQNHDFLYIDTYLEPNEEAKQEINLVKNNLKNLTLIDNNTIIDGWFYPRIINEHYNPNAFFNKS